MLALTTPRINHHQRTDSPAQIRRNKYTGLHSIPIESDNEILVVVSTIIRREDVEDIDLKADLVNAHVILNYKRNESVVVCGNFKLYDSRFRNNDKLHLNKR